MCESRFLEKINGILQHADFQKYMRQNRQAEKDRVFCHHDWQHALDVARICYILCLEKGIFTQSKLDGKLLCYATALLHDIGRFAEAADAHCDHALMSALLAQPILEELSFEQEEQMLILEAIRLHRQKGQCGFAGVFYEADKKSRACFFCEQREFCKKKPPVTLFY